MSKKNLKKTFKKSTAILIIVIYLAQVCAVFAAGRQTLDSAVSDTAAYMYKTVTKPEVGSVGGEWAVLGLARSEYNVPVSYYQTYYNTVEKYVKDCKGILHDKKYTEYSRVILGLTAAGYDPRNVGGYDLTLPLGDFEKTIWQGINGPVFALIALDSMGYAIPENPNAKIQATRERYINEILRRQISDGGWNLTAGANGAVGSNERGDPDITGMALQALAKYQDITEVKTAANKALDFLSKAQKSNGGYTSWGTENVESAVQVLVALCELGIDINDSRFVKNGNTIADNILSFANPNGSFNHTRDGSGNSQMSTEQALYALVAAQRALDGKSSLYRMDDTTKRGVFAPFPGDLEELGEQDEQNGIEKPDEQESETELETVFEADIEPPAEPGLPGKHADVSAKPAINAGKTFEDIKNHKNQTAIEILAAHGIINGKSETVFDPNATMTRAEFAAIVTRSLGLPDKTYNPFTDVSASEWYEVPVATAFFYEIVNGTSATTFNPSGTITRQEAAVMITRPAKLCGLGTARIDAAIRDTLAIFDDYRTVAGWARESLAFCYDAGILDDDNGFAMEIKPTEAVTRAEIAEMLYQMLSLANLL